MNEELLHLAVQIPVVAIFVWFVLKMQKVGMDYLSERNSKAEAALMNVAESLSRVATQLGENEKILERIRERVGD